MTGSAWVGWGELTYVALDGHEGDFEYPFAVDAAPTLPTQSETVKALDELERFINGAPAALPDADAAMLSNIYHGLAGFLSVDISGDDFSGMTDLEVQEHMLSNMRSGLAGLLQVTL